MTEGYKSLLIWADFADIGKWKQVWKVSSLLGCVLVVGGSFGLKEFRTLRYEIMDKRKTVDPETEERLNSRRKKEKVTVDGEFQRMEKQDLDTWHNIRGPRPWEDSKEFQDMQRENIKKQLMKKTETTQ